MTGSAPDGGGRRPRARFGWAVATTWGERFRSVTSSEAFAKAVGGIAGGSIGETVAGLPGVLPGVVAGVAVEETVKNWKRQQEKRQRDKLQNAEIALLANRIFRSSFRPDRLGEISYGRRRAIGWHPDHDAAGTALAEPLGLPVSRLASVPVSDGIPLNLDSDIVVIGGPNATPMTMVAWEFQGDDTRRLGRPEDPVIPLRWYGISDQADEAVRTDTPVGWRMQHVGPIASVNWPLIDTKEHRRWRVIPSSSGITVANDALAYLPTENFLVATRIPNFLHSNFRGISTDLDRNYWPTMLVFEGTHGIGTRAAELLVQLKSLPMLRELETALKGVDFFQAFFRVWNLEEVGRRKNAYHRFTEIKLEDVEPLEIDRDRYLIAHEKAVNTLSDLPQWARE